MRAWLYWTLYGLLTFGTMASAYGWSPFVLKGRCNRSSLPCSSTIGNAGQEKGACCDPSRPKIAECSTQNACVGGQAYAWSRTRLPLLWWLNANQMPQKSGLKYISNQQLKTALQKAWAIWTGPSCTSFSHDFKGATNNPPKADDERVTLFFANAKEWAQFGQGASTLAFTRPVADKEGKIQDADIVFNPLSEKLPWSIDTRSGIHLVRVAGHEIGHVLGFAHTHIQNALMYYANQPTPFQKLTQDDVDAVCSMYPKRVCSKDSDCGACWTCSDQKCVQKNIPSVRRLCQPCSKPSDCGGLRDICVRFSEGNRCAQDCQEQSCCPKGYRCADIGSGQKMCIPSSGMCPDIQCSGDQQCGPGESCQKGVCRPAPVPLHSKTCVVCSSHSECAQGHACVEFPDGKKRCAQPCAADNFCPEGFLCRADKGRYCTPKDWICPCSKDTQCGTDERCQNQMCRPRSCGFGCLCSETALCPAYFDCARGEQARFCIQRCDARSFVSAGALGSPCRADRTCDGDARCESIPDVGDVCLKACKTSSECSATGGKCYVLKGRSFCMCNTREECRLGQICNTTLLGRASGGACAIPQPLSLVCSHGFQCSETASQPLCLPLGGQQGESCGETRACAPGLACVLLSERVRVGICLERCSTSKACTSGGACILQSSTISRLCGCSASVACGKGYRCKYINSKIGLCVLAQVGVCGNGRCEPQKGEQCTSCPQDCGCVQGASCREGSCFRSFDLSQNLPCSKDEQVISKDGVPYCPPKGQCGCSAQRGAVPIDALFGFLLCLGLCIRRRSSKRFD